MINLFRQNLQGRLYIYSTLTYTIFCKYLTCFYRQKISNIYLFLFTFYNESNITSREIVTFVKAPYRLKNVSFSLVWKKQLISYLYHQGKTEISEPKTRNISVLINYFKNFPDILIFCLWREIFYAQLKCCSRDFVVKRSQKSTERYTYTQKLFKNQWGIEVCQLNVDIIIS